MRMCCVLLTINHYSTVKKTLNPNIWYGFSFIIIELSSVDDRIEINENDRKRMFLNPLVSKKIQMRHLYKMSAIKKNPRRQAPNLTSY